MSIKLACFQSVATMAAFIAGSLIYVASYGADSYFLCPTADHVKAVKTATQTIYTAATDTIEWSATTTAINAGNAQDLFEVVIRIDPGQDNTQPGVAGCRYRVNTGAVIELTAAPGILALPLKGSNALYQWKALSSNSHILLCPNPNPDMTPSIGIYLCPLGVPLPVTSVTDPTITDPPTQTTEATTANPMAPATQ